MTDTRKRSGTALVSTALTILTALILAMSLTSCLGSSTDKTLVGYMSDSRIVSARYYTRNTEEDGPVYLTEELDPARLDEFTEVIDSFALNTYFAHTDYFWAGSYGIEFRLEDGTYLSYDGTKLIHTKIPSTDYYESTRDDRLANKIRERFVGISNADFWEEMGKFFDLRNDEKNLSSLN